MNLVDSCGWIEFTMDGANANFFHPVLADAANLIVPSICLYEVYRISRQRNGREIGLAVMALMKQSKVIALGEAIALEAEELGIQYNLSLADSIILATARLHNATLWTQDAHFAGIDGVQFRAKPQA